MILLTFAVPIALFVIFFITHFTLALTTDTCYSYLRTNTFHEEMYIAHAVSYK